MSGCIVEGCVASVVVKSRSLCDKHYTRFKRHGDPYHLTYREPAPKGCDWDTYLRHYGWMVTETGCWEWLGKIGSRGYGQSRGATLVHRVAYATWVGPIPEGNVVRHKCDNPPCINPEHLEAGTHSDNSRDMVQRGRCADQRGGKGPRAVLTVEEVIAIREEYARGVLTQNMLAEAYGVTQTGISAVIRHKTWTNH